jgi:hypothetical protein
MSYKATKESDGTYTIRYAANLGVCLVGIRGCNVSRTIRRLNDKDAVKDHKRQKAKQPVTIHPYCCPNG